MEKGSTGAMLPLSKVGGTLLNFFAGKRGEGLWNQIYLVTVLFIRGLALQ